MKNAIILCSGGLDSVTTAHYVKKKLNYENIRILFFDYGQKALKQERTCSKKCVRDLKADFVEINLDWIKNISNSLINKNGRVKKLKINQLKNTKKESDKYYVPCRNTIFLTYALALAESLLIKDKQNYDIFVGFKCEGKESYPDTTKEFVNKINELSKISCNGRFRIIAPLIEKDKEDIILLGKKLNVDFKHSFSCYLGKNKHCGYCLACRLRQSGFYWANTEDPTEYLEK